MGLVSFTAQAYTGARGVRRGAGDAAPPGSMVHIAAIGDDGLMRVIEVWESRDQAEAFAEKVIEARTEIGVAPVRPQVQYLEVHKIAQEAGATA